LNAKGVTLKPSEYILKDFIKRLNTLNRDIVTDILLEKMNEFIESGDESDIKLLIKCLYMVEEILNNKIEGYDKIFKNRLDIFENLSNGDNKKVVEVSTNIVNILNGNKNKSNKNILEVHSSNNR
jgi:hypothetical protein